ncbi:hypothetical protein [Synechococcus sp. A15-44]|uniref:hypothetical protein n=1 Tax=Synechococcus sp. A15-44 TaxID=1050646 RepID=UPI001644D800|nr:hypothetical protein [Synechococcus sp. A15-44]
MNLDFLLLGSFYLKLAIVYFLIYLLAVFFFAKITYMKNASLRIYSFYDNIFNAAIKKSKNSSSIVAGRGYSKLVIIVKYFLCFVILGHFLLFLMSDGYWSSYEYLGAYKPNFYYAFARVSAAIAKIIPILAMATIALQQFSKKLTLLYLVSISCSILFLSSLNSRFTGLVAFIFIITAANKFKFKDMNSHLYRITTFLFALFFAGYFLLNALKFRSISQGLSNVFDLNTFQLEESLVVILVSMLTSTFSIYSALLQQITQSTNYLMFSFSPLPSFLHGLDSNYFNDSASRVGVYSPSPGYVDIITSQDYLVFIPLFAVFFAIPIFLASTPEKYTHHLNNKIFFVVRNIINIALGVSLMIMSLYQVRLSMRLAWFSVILFLIIPYFLAPQTNKSSIY